MSKKPVKSLSILLVAFMLLTSIINVSSLNLVFADKAEHIVISEIYGGGGNSGAVYKNDYIELYNPTNTDISLDGWSVQYASAAGTSYQVTALSGTIRAYSYYLIQEASGTNAAPALPAPDTTGGINMSGTAGKVALVSSTTALIAGSLENVVDYVGFGTTASVYEGSGSTPAPSNSTSVERKANDGTNPTAEGDGKGNGWDTDNNASDFVTAVPNPQNTASPMEGGIIVDTMPPVITHTPVLQGNINEDISITAQVSDDRRVSSVKLYYRIKGQSTYAVMDMLLIDDVYSIVLPKEQLDVAGLEYYIEASDGTNISTMPEDINSPYMVAIDTEDIAGPIISDLLPADRTSTGSNLRPVVSASFSDESGIAAGSIKLLVDDADVTTASQITETGIVYNTAVDFALGNHSVKLEVTDTKGNKSEAVWNFSVGVKEKSLYFGQLHSHTTNSDGIGTLDDAYSHARDVAGLDFFAVTDHSNSLESFDTKVSANNATIADGSKSVKWNNGLAAADNYTTPDFVGIYAYEMTWSNGTGHMNTFNTAGFENRQNPVYAAADGLKQYYEVLKTSPGSISQFNHPGKTFGDFNDFANYDPIIDSRITLLEVGNGEGAIRSSGYFPSYEFYTRALDKGWHVSPTNNQDNHKGLWGDANTARTVILASDLTREGIYDAMRNMHTYATEDNNLHISYTLNGEEMGTILAEKPELVNIKVALDDSNGEALGKVSVIVNGGKVAASQVITTSRDTIEFQLEPNYSYYYIRVDEADKDIAVTAPVWIGEVERAGISGTISSTALPVKGDKITITTNLYNNTNIAMEVNAIEYFINGEAIHTASAVPPVNAYGVSAYSFDYAPAAAGKYSIDVKLTAVMNGVEKQYTDVLKLEVVDPAIVTNIVVDASHNNDYVSGYYAGNMTNLITLANSEKINVILLKDKITDEALKNASLLLLSPPAKKSGTASGVSYTASYYTDDEIAAIQRFANNGGNIVVTALADYQDSRTDEALHSSYQQNLVLEAIGAGSRINDDEVIDYDNNPNVIPAGVAGGTPYRIPMNAYNMTSSYLNGVEPAQNYSFYSGCSITLGTNAQWLVKGTPTTYGFDSDNDTLGGSYVSSAAKTMPADTGIGKGNVVALAAETLPGGGKLFIGGTVFYSNFEIKVQLDNAAQLQNSNYNITMNILDSIKRVIPVTAIQQVRSAQMGDTYCVEGTVTAGTIKDNAFFDTIYIQDQTGGINIFPISGTDILVGQKVKVIGTVDQYQGEIELRVIEAEVTDTAVNPIAPTELSTGAAMDISNGGKLVKVEGVVTRMDAQNLYVNDGSGEARVFVDGYIGDGSNDPAKAGKWDSSIKAGDRISAIGLASQDPEGARLRVRNTAEIVKLSTGVDGISLDKTNETIAVNAILQLNAIVTPADATNKTVAWTSSNTAVATVDENGIVTGHSIGFTVITAVTEDGNYTAACNVTVVNTPVNEVRLNKHNITIKLGKEEKILVNVGPGNADLKDVVWTYSNDNIRIIQKNDKLVSVEALAEGTAVITVTSKDGGYTDTCVVTVVKK